MYRFAIVIEQCLPLVAAGENTHCFLPRILAGAINTMRMILRTLPALCAVLGIFCFSAADWLQFRGSDNNGVATDQHLPLTWDKEKNIAWKAPLPGTSASSPIVVADRVIVTNASGYNRDRLHVLCFDANTGKQLWERQFWATGRTMCHTSSSVAAPSPASDGQRIFAFYSSNDLICLDLDGNLQWLRGLTFDHPTAANDIGMASSPVVADGAVIVQVENQGESFVAGIDAVTGENLWSIPRQHAANWASPAVVRGNSTQGDLVVVQDSKSIMALKPRTGAVEWQYDAKCAGIASAMSAEGKVFVPADEGLIALDARQGSADPVSWKSNKLIPSSPSPVVHDGKVFVMKRSVLACGDSRNGETLWETRVKGQRFWATPVLAGGHLYVANDSGLVQVVDIRGDKGEVVAENDLGETILGTPAVANGALYVQTANHLWKIAETK